jgi:outer membrane protein assembly factor BamB
MRNFIFHYFILFVVTCTLNACTGAYESIFEKDNTPKPTPLGSITAEIKPQSLWSRKVGSGAGNEHLKLGMALSATRIFATNANGVVSSVDKTTGQLSWQIATGVPITTGPGAGDNIVVVGSRSGDVIALDQTNGKIVWQAKIAGEILANPAISDQTVIIKAVDGRVSAFSASDGVLKWTFQQSEPTLILRGASTPKIDSHYVYIGFANGNLAKLTVTDGRLLWLQPIALSEGSFAVTRMIDIDAEPIIVDHRTFAATYQGKISALDLISGRVLWSHDISSYSGMTANEHSTFISDAKGHVWSFNADTGLTNWRQNQLEARRLTGPALMGPAIVVGDGEGYLHWLSKTDGHFMARAHLGGEISAAPLVENNVLYVLNTSGSLAAYQLSPS